MEKAKKIQILKDIINIKSVNGNEKAVADYLTKLFNEYGIETQQVAYDINRDNLVVEIGTEGSKVLAFSGHMDVVASGNLADWTTDPFAADERDGNIYGRGACDMKSGLAAMVITMIELVQEKAELNGKIKLLATVGEEVGELGSEQLTREGYADDVTSMIIGEPSGYHIIYSHQGSINFSVSSKGKSSHSSMPKLGINAIDHLVEFYTRANNEFRKTVYTNDVLGDFIYNVTMISGGEQINSIPEKATLEGNIRTIPEYDNQKTVAKLNEIIDDLNKEKEYHLELTIEANKLVVKSERDSDIATIAQKIAETKIGQKVPLLGMPGTTDAAEFIKAKNTFPIIVFGPGNETPHQVNEYVGIANYLDMIEVYKEIAKDYLNH
ncbi:succinyl-diaminopimelate desuccinylase [Carnobacterium divergens]|uniref:ArgE/DapE family deacylase n=1 Tax=Carnobacterium divergens TaxID=2748 RepID=UPI001072802E|nr:ArgE/DapE family deacylase [Carnobacterium divergens]TFJ48381.1 succinyl-diaminopimelate desuccinylase [Carnobacterium divergens]TFJ54876.1 succinyl-diaminopimelate desuccinylase [Carnobacterium divergens]